MFYTFDQSNPGGSYDTSMPYTVIIEANSAEEANERAESIGVYFDGIEKGLDCECCNDRWYRTSTNEATITPMRYNIDIYTYGTEELPGIKVYYLDGTVKNARNGKTKLTEVLK